jgi:hypothetical protein
VKYILHRKQFEKLGVVPEIDDIIKVVQDKLGQGETEFTLQTNLRGKDTEIKFIHNPEREEYKGASLHSYFQLTDANPELPKFTISLGDLKSSTIAHELKHLDRELSREMIADFSYYLNHVGRDVIQNMSHLAKDEESEDLLSLSLYLINKDEYEAYFNEFQREIQSMINPEMSQEEKERVIREYLEDQDIYLLYKEIDEAGGFNLESYFKDRTSMLKYLSAFTTKMEEFIEDNPEYEEWEKIKGDESNTPSGMSKIAKKINHHFSTRVKEGLRRFNRLYVIA